LPLFREILGNHIAPIALIIAIGYGFYRHFNPDLQSIGRVSLYIFSPALILSGLLNRQISNNELSLLSGYAGVLAMINVSLAVLCGWLLRANRSQFAALILTNTALNGGNYGLPLTRFAFGDQAYEHALVFFAASSVLIYTLGVFVAASGSGSIRAAFRTLLRMPVIYATLIALVLRWQQVVLPPVLARPIDLFAQAAIPVMLLILGMQIARNQLNQNTLVSGQKRFLVIGLVLRLLIAPIVGVLFVVLGKLTPLDQGVVVLQAVMPTAVVTSLLALEFGLQPAYINYMILTSTLASPIILTPLIAWLKTR
jgi:predicted permease